jgi:putative hydrolase of the HAD superfamily
VSRAAPWPGGALAGVGLDATGTLFEAVDLGREYARVLARHGIELDAARLRELVPEVWREFACAADPRRDRFAAHPGGARGFWREVLDRLLARAGAPPASPFAAAELYERFAEPDAWRLYDDVVPALERLRSAGLRLAVISNWDERLPRLLEGLGLARFFDELVLSCEVGVEKPHPAIFAAAARRLGAEPARLVHVGDRRLEDLEGARAAGWHALLVDRGRAPRREPGGTETLRGLDELAARLAPGPRAGARA